MGVATVVILCAVAVCLVVAGALIAGSKDDDDHDILDHDDHNDIYYGPKGFPLDGKFPF